MNVLEGCRRISLNLKRIQVAHWDQEADRTLATWNWELGHYLFHFFFSELFCPGSTLPSLSQLTLFMWDHVEPGCPVSIDWCHQPAYPVSIEWHHPASATDILALFHVFESDSSQQGAMIGPYWTRPVVSQSGGSCIKCLLTRCSFWSREAGWARWTGLGPLAGGGTMVIFCSW